MKMVAVSPRRIFVSLLATAAVLAVAGCSAKHFRREADKEVYDIIAHKRKAALGEDKPFTLERPGGDPLEGLPRRRQPVIPEAADDNADDDPPVILSLAAAVGLAIRNSRDYQFRKETVYLSALSLTLERDAYKPTFTGLLSGEWQRPMGDQAWAGDTSFGVSQLFASGAEFTMALTSDFLRYTTGSPRSQAASTLAFQLVQPLWRGAGRRIAQENLTQAEREVAYELRSFTRYHKTFAVSVVNEYYQILQQRARMRNEWNNYRRLVRARERSAALARAGRMPEFQVDQAHQDELRARDRFIRSRQTYKQRLDAFKLTLALPTETPIDVDEADLTRLMAAGLVHPALQSEETVTRALALRLDLMTAEDEAADAERKVAVAKNGLAPDVALVLAADVVTKDDTKPLRFGLNRATYSAGLDLDLALERTAERNAYRQALITRDRARRAARELRDEIKQQVRQAWRSLQEAKESYDIQRRSLALAERRVDSTTLLLEAGRASTRDLLESQAALLEAQNALVSVLVDHTIAKLALWRDLGTLAVSTRGTLEGHSP